MDYLAQCDQLNATQGEEQAEHRQKWREYNDRRKANHYRMTGQPEQKQAQGLNLGPSYGYGLSRDFSNDQD